MQQCALVELEINHKCWCIELSEKFRQSSLTGIPTHAKSHDRLAHTFVIKTEDAPKVIEFIKNHPMTTNVRLIKKSKDSLIIYVEQPRNSLFVNSASAHGAILTGPTLSTNGTDRVSLFFSDEKNIKNLFCDLNNDFELKLKSKIPIDMGNLSIETFNTSAFFRMQTANAILSARQKEVFSLACKRGYFKIPKNVSIEELANELELDATTTADHLRRAQNKLSPMISDILSIS